VRWGVVVCSPLEVDETVEIGAGPLSDRDCPVATEYERLGDCEFGALLCIEILEADDDAPED
jgi:hypothetical protein